MTQVLTSSVVYLQPANATEKAVSDLLCDVKQILGDLLDDVKGLTGLDASGLLGDVTDVNAVGNIVADLLKVSVYRSCISNIANLSPSSSSLLSVASSTSSAAPLPMSSRTCSRTSV